MYYYEIYDDYAIKYKVSINMPKLVELRKEIINNCSYITHECYNTINIPEQIDKDHIKNFTKRKINVFSNSNPINPCTYEYVVEFDYYHHPKIIYLIDKLLKGNTNIVNLLNDNKFDKSKIVISNPKEIINEIPNEKNKTFNSKFQSLIESQEILLKLYENQKYNSNQVSIDIYISEVLNCITFKKIAVTTPEKANINSNPQNRKLILKKRK